MTEYFCIACGRKHKRKSSKYCGKHETQLKKFGKVLDNNPRTKFDPNEFRFINDYVEFDTYSAPSCEVYRTYIIDAEDYPLVSKYKWSSLPGDYARAIINGKHIKLHHLILNAKPGQQIDHIDINPLNNRKSNLRIANQSLQSMNRKGYNKLGIKGIELHSKINKYSAYFRINNKQYHSKCYKLVEEAVFARYILEQMLSEHNLTQHHTDLIEKLSEERKEEIIEDCKKKFNR